MTPRQMMLARSAPADALLGRDPLALLIGLVLDQQVPMEKAFVGPYELSVRLGHDLDAAELAGADPDEFAALFARPPALHRFPGSMAGRVQAMCRVLVDDYGGDATRIWSDASDGATLLRRVRALPGFGDAKARITVALLGKQFDVQPAGWREAAGDYGGKDVYRSVADITDDASLARVRAYKKERKAAAKAAAGQ
jgi:uncharacterized HhH-GPD family protein